MKKLEMKDVKIDASTIVFAYTTPNGYEMRRFLLLEKDDDTYIIVEGDHCSCYDFEDIEWTAMEYTLDELKKIADGTLKMEEIYIDNDSEKHLYEFIRNNL